MTGRTGLRVLGMLSLALAWMPLWAPLIQVTTLACVVVAACRGGIDRLSITLGAAGAALGLFLFLMLQYVWVI
ncbi:MAG: hypothetical protein DMF50_13675 [Acidobacteria bacterium]|nr:MAG: hypothetical protein DMF50_13675 [Acidobacteriota bacterium]